jgi:hypothetical protein
LAQLGNFLRILLGLMVDNLALKLVVEVRNLLMVFLVRRMNLLLFENSNDFKKLSFFKCQHFKLPPALPGLPGAG